MQACISEMQLAGGHLDGTGHIRMQMTMQPADLHEQQNAGGDRQDQLLQRQAGFHRAEAIRRDVYDPFRPRSSVCRNSRR
jgi:hypothetical protein